MLCMRAGWVRCRPMVAQVMMPDVVDALQGSDEFLSVDSGDWFEDDLTESFYPLQ